MKVVKPQRLGVLFHPYERRREFYLATTCMMFFPFDAPSSLLSEVNLWKFATAELGKDAVLDVGMPKPRAELLVTGSAYPRNPPQIACSVRATLGPIDKKLWVVGDRFWRRGVASEPVPFAEMPVSYAHAFGGPTYPSNPLGKGAEPLDVDGVNIHSLPNVEIPDRLVKSPADRPPVAGFGPYDLMWPQRFSKIGTYDTKWLETRFPGLADDLDPTFFNTAPDDQQAEGWFSPNQTFRLENLNAEQGVIESRLPNCVARCFVTLRDRKAEGLVEVPMVLETVHLFPHAQRGIVLFRGQIRIAEDDAYDVLHALVACETPGAPRDKAHYDDVLRRRLDKKTGAEASLRESDLMPIEPAPAYAEASDVDEMTALVTQKGAMRRNFRNRAAEEREKILADVIERGLDPSIVPPLPPDESPPDLDTLPEFVEGAMRLADEKKAEAERISNQAIADARKACEERGIDFDQLVEKERQKQAGPPKFRAKAELEGMREMLELAHRVGKDLPELEAKLADPRFPDDLEATERTMREAYVAYAHYFPTAARLDGDEARTLRAEVTAALTGGEGLSGRDLTGANLSGMDLHGVDLHDTMLENADLTRVDLTGANLEGAVLAKADLSSAILDGARLAKANLGASKLAGATLRGADLSSAVLSNAELVGADLSGAKLDGAVILESKMRAACFEKASAAGVTFIRCDVTTAKFDGADLTKSNFVESPAVGASFAGAKLEKTLFLGVEGGGANFDGAAGAGLRLVHGCRFEEATFRGAVVPRANFRGAKLADADFTNAVMDGADFSEAELRGAQFYRATARAALFIRSDLREANLTSADLIGAILQKANLRSAVLRGANLVRADLLRVNMDQGTDLRDAELAEVRFIARERVDEQG